MFRARSLLLASASLLLAACGGAGGGSTSPIPGVPQSGPRANVLNTSDLSAASTFRVLYTFPGGSAGQDANGDLAIDDAGNLYGTTGAGGNAACQGGCGVVYQLTPTGTETVLHAFDGQDGYWPRYGVIRDDDGNLYGVNFFGGASTTCASEVGCGDVFEIASGGAFSVLHSFKDNGTDGYYPLGDVSWSGTKLYGVTEAGGAGGCGAVYAVKPSSDKEHEVINWPNALGCGPIGKLHRSSGNLYGAYQDGGSTGAGGVFKITPSKQITILYAFQGGNDGKFPFGGPIEDASGNLYGVTAAGGGPCNCGIVYEISSTGVETILHAFTGANGDGNGPLGQLVRDAKGNLYGVTEWGGANGEGTVFKVTPAGVERILHTFTGNADGGVPEGSLLRDSSGNLYGTASTTVFEITP